VLHVGLPKTGTTSLQQLLWANRESLQTADVHLVVPTMRELFDAARDLTRDGSADWRRLVDAVRQSPGTVVLSCEGLSAVRPSRPGGRWPTCGRPTSGSSARCVTRPGCCRRCGSSTSAPAPPSSSRPFVAHARDGMGVGVVAVHARCAGRLVRRPPRRSGPARDRPPVECGPERLLAPVRTAADLDPGLATEVPPPGNTSIPAVQVELLRRVNLALGDRRPVGQPRYRELVRPLQGPRAVARATGTLAELTPDDHAWAADCAQRLVEALRERGHLVLGDLEELLPEPAGSASTAAPDATSDADVASAAAGLAADLLLALRAARRDGGGAGHPASRGPPRPQGRGGPRA